QEGVVLRLLAWFRCQVLLRRFSNCNHFVLLRYSLIARRMRSETCSPSSLARTASFFISLGGMRMEVCCNLMGYTVSHLLIGVNGLPFRRVSILRHLVVVLFP